MKGNSKEAGSLIVQTKMSDKLGMCWKIEYQGNNLYFIRSALYSKLLLGIKEENISIETNLVTTINEEMGLWKIIGFIPFQ